MGRERGNRQRKEEIHREELECVQAQAERKGDKAWQKTCNQLKRKVGGLQKEIANWELESRERAVEWEEQEEAHKVTVALLRQENDVRLFLC
jgi:hypothetical protein